MQAFILTGYPTKISDYIDSFREKNNISSYFSVSYEDFKISDARNIQKIISRKLGLKEKRMFTISNPTLEAQNAILKTVEELPENVFIFFTGLSKNDFLPTISSRSKILDLGQDVFEDPVLEEQIVQIFSKEPDMNRLYSLINRLETEEEIKNLILALRNSTREFVKNGLDYRAIFIFMEKIISNFSLIKSNNLNKRFALENACVLASEPDTSP